MTFNGDIIPMKSRIWNCWTGGFGGLNTSQPEGGLHFRANLNHCFMICAQRPLPHLTGLF